jgi:hypothetical protein
MWFITNFSSILGSITGHGGLVWTIQIQQQQQKN